nr:unnamed protein product [Digitaria exilis]
MDPSEQEGTRRDPARGTREEMRRRGGRERGPPALLPGDHRRRGGAAIGAGGVRDGGAERAPSVADLGTGPPSGLGLARFLYRPNRPVRVSNRTRSDSTRPGLVRPGPPASLGRRC